MAVDMCPYPFHYWMQVTSCRLDTETASRMGSRLQGARYMRPEARWYTIVGMRLIYRQVQDQH